MVILKKVLLLFILVILVGCGHGTYTNPEIPASASGVNQDYATVYLFLPHSFWGIIDRAIYDSIVLVDWDKAEVDKPIPPEHIMIANWSSYSKLNLNPGVHTFSVNTLGKEIVKLDAGKEYFLAIKIAFGGTPYLWFVSKDDFLENTKGLKQIRLTSNFVRGIWKNKFEVEEVKD